jgi:hypothetical protein
MTEMNDEDKQYEKQRNYLWSYFQLHSSQRLTTVNFFILISTVIITGYWFGIDKFPFLGIIIGIVLILISFVFWKLDQRNRFIIKNVESALRYLESKNKLQDNSNTPHMLNIFSYEEKLTSELKSNSVLFWNRHFTYTACFNTIFVIFASLGLLGVIFSIILIIYVK